MEISIFEPHGTFAISPHERLFFGALVRPRGVGGGGHPRNISVSFIDFIDQKVKIPPSPACLPLQLAEF